MTTSDPRELTRHERGRDRNTPRETHTDDVDSHVSEPTRRGGRHTHHKKEENGHKERTTKMTKRTARVLTSVAAAIAFICTLTVSTRGSNTNWQSTNETRASIKTTTLRTESGFENTGTVEFFKDTTTSFARTGIWGSRQTDNYTRASSSSFTFNTTTIRDTDNFETTSFRVRQSRTYDWTDRQTRLTTRRTGDSLFDGQVETRGSTFCTEYGFTAGRTSRSETDLAFRTGTQRDITGTV